METPWGNLAVADAHVHFFSHRFFSALAEQKKATLDSIQTTLGWQLPAENPEQLADVWIQELDRHGVAKAAIIASVPGDHNSVMAAVQRFPQRFYGSAMVNPIEPNPILLMTTAPSNGLISRVRFFLSIHRNSF